MIHKARLRGSVYMDAVIGMALGTAVALAVFTYSAMSAKIMGAEISEFTSRAKIYDLAKEFTGDISGAKSVRVSGDGAALEIFYHNSGENNEHNSGTGNETDNETDNENNIKSETAVYEYKDGCLYFTAKNNTVPMRVLKAEKVFFQHDRGIVTLTAVPKERSSFKIEISAYLRAEL